MPTQIKVADLYIPNRREYVRGTAKRENLERLRAVVRSARGPWPFHTPITVRRLPKPIMRKKHAFPFFVVDGVHRTLIAREQKWKVVPAEVRTLTDTQTEVEQLRINLGHGALVDKPHRDAWVRHLIKDRKLTVPTLAKSLGLTERSVYRMLRGEQTKPAGTARAKAEKAPKAEKVTPPKWTVEDFFTRAAALGKEVKDHQDTLVPFVNSHAAGVLRVLEPFNDLIHQALATEAK